MRKCPVCGSDDGTVIGPYVDPHDEYVHSLSVQMCACTCGMHYLDAQEFSQEWFDKYYTTVYTTDDKPYSKKRLNSLASLIASYEPNGVLDIGGTDGELQHKLNQRGVPCDVSGVGDDNQKKYDIVVLSHTLEHIYDVSSMFSRILRNLGNRLIIEVPIWYDYQNLGYDLHWQHINKFTKHHLEELLLNYGFQISASESILDYREYHCHRVMAWVL